VVTASIPSGGSINVAMEEKGARDGETAVQGVRRSQPPRFHRGRHAAVEFGRRPHHPAQRVDQASILVPPI